MLSLRCSAEGTRQVAVDCTGRVEEEWDAQRLLDGGQRAVVVTNARVLAQPLVDRGNHDRGDVAAGCHTAAASRVVGGGTLIPGDDDDAVVHEPGRLDDRSDVGREPAVARGDQLPVAIAGTR